MSIDGILLVDKDRGPTSHDVVARVRRLAGMRKVGHAGTLDPMATGLLVLGLGRGTRLLTYLVGADKTYEATIRLGESTPTDDADSEPDRRLGIGGGADRPALDAALETLRGPIQQRPSAVSAIKVDGKRAYARVRDGEEVLLPERPVTVHRLEVTGERTGISPSGTAVLDLDVTVECSSGTYIRAIARDLGEALGVGGHLIALRRTRVAPFDVAEAMRLEDAEGVDALTLTEAATRCFATLTLSEIEAADVRIGRSITAPAEPGIHAALAPDGHVLALVEERGGVGRPVLVLDPA